ncbi:Laminin subunit gamma-1 [Stylophora pistillata]|uniref:Laminin subunit gamma-1 n=2 Tax=Stylophora pistillata TaxID=50429 RepID=A0A2B4R5Y8_STYPI|nr:Laminin subunit gamma-1 [Stylophora pistillata]
MWQIWGRSVSQPRSNCVTSNLLVVLCLFAIFAAISGQDSCSTGPCYPTPSDISTYFNVTANSTCGESPEPYCINLDCSKICNANDPNLTHPASFVNDDFRDNTFWKSKNYEFPVFLQLEVRRTFMLYQSVVTFSHELPAAMYLLKSNDSGRTWSPLSYFATNCTKYFNLPETPENEIEGLKVQCFKIDTASNLNKQLFYTPMKDPAAAQDLLTDTEKQAFFLMTDIKMVLVKFIIPGGVDTELLSDSLKRSFFFTVSDWDVLASCFCNGQASQCDKDDLSKCICESNTDGLNCEKCLPLYNNKPYQIREACEACECNRHADSCSYNETKRYGVCNDCKHNTTGDKCELCMETFYRNPAVSQNASNTCLACACHVPGVNSSADSSRCDSDTGQCACKSLVTGRACDMCRDTYWKLTADNDAGCEECHCNLTGTENGSDVCDKITGQCPCKQLLIGRTCNQCQDGYFGLTSEDPGCTACNCDMAGSVNTSCSSSGKCYCRPKFSGDKCEKIDEGFFVPSVHFMTFQAEDATPITPQTKRISHEEIDNAAGNKVLMVGVVLNEGMNNSSPTELEFTVNIPKTGFFNFVLRYKTGYNWNLVKITALLRTAFVPFTCNNIDQITKNEPLILTGRVLSGMDAHDYGSQCLLAGQYSVKLQIPAGSAQQGVLVTRRRRRALPNAEITVDSVLVMPTVTEYDVFKEASAEVQQNMTFYYNVSSSLKTWSADSEEGSQALAPVFGSIFGEGKACNCSSVGSNNPDECDRYSGQCSCKPNVIGRTCDQCRPDYFNFTSGQGCQDCDCNRIGANETSCHPETGQCSCMKNVIGQHCEQCETNYYNFNSGAGCSSCNCNPTYSTSLQCDGNTGVCSCKPGVNGAKCTGCADQFYNLTDQGCISCECNLAGSASPVCNKTTGHCPCKAQSLGRQCDMCPAGYYGLSVQNPQGCLKCQCSNKSSDCVTDPGWFASNVNTSLSVFHDSSDLDGWTAVDSAGNQVTLLLDWDVRINIKKGSMKVDTQGSNDIYFVAPDKYLGDKRSAYTYTLSFHLQQDNASSPATSSKGDVILEGKWFDEPLVSSLATAPPDGGNFRKYEVKLVQSNWRVGNTSGRQPSSYEMIVVLSNLTSLRIRAKWTTRTTKLITRLADIELTLSSRGNVIPGMESAFNIENCTCPVEYRGQFCEQCACGYTRVTPNGGPYVTCVPCECNGHSDECDPETGVCLDCKHNTTGDHCEKCSDGWYGNATNATPNDCSPCPCPSRPNAVNQFAKTCVLSSDGLPTCVNCTVGHEGRYCERCMDGYFGRPREQDGQCRKCNCNNNTDPAVTGNCNTTTGECLKCLYNTSGSNCQWCAPGYHGNALDKNCTRCNCSTVGALNNECNNMTGSCYCQPHVTGKLCDRCEVNAFNYTEYGCSPCNCDVDGSRTLQCDSSYGNCTCRPNVIGEKCDKCKDHFFDVKQHCLACNCTANQTMANTTCDRVSGQCDCETSEAGGTPPTCHPCTEDCYLNWENSISRETVRVKELYGNVTELLKSFGSMSVDSINSTLQKLKENVTYAEEIFSSGGKEDLQKKQQQINRIQNSISSLQRQLNDSKSLIEDAQTYISKVVTNFTGSIRIVPTDSMMYSSSPEVCPSGGGMSVIVDWKCIEAMATIYRLRAVEANESGHANYSSIQSSYSMIQQANATAYHAAKQITDSLEKLSLVTLVRERVESDVGDAFQALYRNNSMRLEEINKINEMLQALVKEAEMIGEQANGNLTMAVKTANRSKDLAGQRKREAQSALDNATNAHSDTLQANTEANNALKAAMSFEENATMVLEQTQDALGNVSAGINTIARVINMTKEATSIADEVRAMNMPVSLQQIQNLTDEILNTNVSQEMVNQTLKAAQDGLEQAREVEALSQRAVNVAQETLNQVQGIETALNSSEHIRQQVTSLQQETDGMVADINNITETVEHHFSASYSAGQSLLTKINETLDNMEEGLTCFDTAKNEALNASRTAELAFNISKEAKETFDNSTASLPPVASLVNSSYEAASGNFSEIQQAHQDSEQLLTNVTDAEELLAQYIAQRDELERLGRELQELDKEADQLLGQYSVAAEQYSQCTGA